MTNRYPRRAPCDENVRPSHQRFSDFGGIRHSFDPQFVWVGMLCDGRSLEGFVDERSNTERDRIRCVRDTTVRTTASIGRCECEPHLKGQHLLVDATACPEGGRLTRHGLSRDGRRGARRTTDYLGADANRAWRVRPRGGHDRGAGRRRSVRRSRGRSRRGAGGIGAA